MMNRARWDAGKVERESGILPFTPFQRPALGDEIAFTPKLESNAPFQFTCKLRVAVPASCVTVFALFPRIGLIQSMMYAKLEDNRDTDPKKIPIERLGDYP